MSETGPWVNHGTVSSVWSGDQFFSRFGLRKIFIARSLYRYRLRDPQLELGYYSSYQTFDDTFKWVSKSQKLSGSIYFDIGRPENVDFRLCSEFTTLYKPCSSRGCIHYKMTSQYNRPMRQ